MSSPYASPKTSPKYHPTLQTIWEDSCGGLEELPLTPLQMELMDMEEAQLIQDVEEPVILNLPCGSQIPKSLLTELLEDALDQDDDSSDSDEEEAEVFTYPSDEEEEVDYRQRIHIEQTVH
eukprot:TRINITY_DN1335_c0_g1_i4.p1 TRINITY_DN1335_c0_g1~~TRINITY_DN1335_c0_g1_i4.p1  ORF type:complete len:121 (+),score=14.38 TRINITY_DN1335_c0_g1_i4:103-465(+)